jgi:AmiR/NasT family two-component response regulator
LVIGQAEGLLMNRHNIDPDAAFRLLVKLSQETHVKLRDVAQRIVAAHTGRTSPAGG